VPIPPAEEIGGGGSVRAQVLAGIAGRECLFRGGVPNFECCV